MCKLVFCFFLFLGTFFAIEARSEDPPSTVVAEATIQNKFGLNFTASASLGSLPSDKKIPVSIRVFNSTEISFDIVNLEAKCGCLLASSTVGGINPGESTLFSFVLTTPKISKQTDVGVNVTLHNVDGNTVNLLVKYQLAGILSFTGPIANVELPSDKQEHEFFLPFIATSPVTTDSIEIFPSDELAGMKFELVKLESGNAIACKLDKAFIVPAVGVLGRVTLRSPETEKVASIDVVLMQVQPVSISPSVLYFRRNEETDEYDAKAIVRVNASDSDKPGFDAIMDGSIDDRPIPTNYKHLGNGVYAVKFKLSKAVVSLLDESANEVAKLRVSARTSVGSWNLECRVLHD